MRFISIILLIALLENVPDNTFGQGLPTETSTVFAGSGLCAICHQPGVPNVNALRDASGNDVSPVTLWRSTMMSNAAKDQFSQAFRRLSKSI